MSGCPLGSGGAGSAKEASPLPLQEANRSDDASGSAKLPTGRARIRLLYEQYVHLPQLRAVWESPTTQRPVLEPLFAAGFHGVELCLLLLAEFVADPRTYVAKRPRIELVADDIAAQCQLLTEVVDAELEEELQEGAAPASRLSLTQPFPFEGCPPTKAGPCHSPGLQRLTNAVCASLGGMTAAERNSLIRVVLNISAAFASFQRWSVGLGVERQLNALRASVGLREVQFPHRLNLDYDALVRPWLCEQTLTDEIHTNREDFFFRTVHLGTDCWAFVALRRMASALQLAQEGAWHVAAARATQAARILSYLGQHVLLLTSMNLRDYLHLKVELEGTSGEGSVQVKNFRPTVTSLFEPLAAAVLGREGASASEDEQRELLLLEGLMGVYEYPDQHPELYAFCKALETLETGVLGGFYFQHFCLATHVIGSQARGTMGRAVAALKSAYEAPIFPLLDRCRVELGVRIDAEVADRKGKVMHQILRKHLQQQQGKKEGSSATGASSVALPNACPFGFSRNDAPLSQPQPALPAAADGFEAALRRLYSWEGVPAACRDALASETARQAGELGLAPHPSLSTSAGGGSSSGSAPLPNLPLSFLDHAWGQMAPLAQYRAWREAAALHQLGNPAWDALFGRIMPQAVAHIKTLLGLPADSAACTVHFGSNSHELVSRLMSAFLDRRCWRQDSESGGPTAAAAAVQGELQGAVPLRVLTSDSEFYSITRQLNRFVEAGLAVVDIVPADSTATFPERCCAAVAAAAAEGRQYGVIYISQLTYLQQTLVPSIPALVGGLRAAAGAAAGAGGQATAPEREPLIIVDAYHGFMALPTELGSAAGDCCYVAGLLKHAGCGANCAFLTLPARLASLRPVLTGWLADPSVLAPGSAGIQIGSEVGYCAELALQGGTPAFMMPLLTFNHLMELWRETCPTVTVEALHNHVVALHRVFLAGLDAAGHPALNSRTLVALQDEPCRSHTLVFRQPSAAAAQAVVEVLRQRGVLVDSRNACVRIGCGANHSTRDIETLLTVLRASAAGAS